MIQRDGFSAAQVGTLLGASGGAKWLVLSQIDRVLLRRLVPELQPPVFLLGSSIGAWRFACYAQRSPIAAIERFERLYVNQRYSDKPDIDEITRKSSDILSAMLGESGVEDVLSHPTLRTNILTVRSRHLLASERRPLLIAGLLVAMLSNAVSRRTLGGFFARGLFFDARDEPPFLGLDDFPIHRIALSADNLADAVVASGSIPLVLSGVRDVAGAPAGVYRDGGVIDYHLDLSAAAEGKIALFPHFFDWLKPGWFDKNLRWRWVDPQNLDRTVVICPSPDFIASLPGGKVPDRTDFVRLPTEERIARWRAVLDRCRRLGEELEEVLDRGILPARLEPF